MSFLNPKTRNSPEMIEDRLGLQLVSIISVEDAELLAIMTKRLPLVNDAAVVGHDGKLVLWIDFQERISHDDKMNIVDTVSKHLKEAAARH